MNNPVATGSLYDVPPPVEVRTAQSPYEIKGNYTNGWQPVEMPRLTEYDEHGAEASKGALRGVIVGELAKGETVFIRHQLNPGVSVPAIIETRPHRSVYDPSPEWAADFTAYGSVMALGPLDHAGGVAYSLPAVDAGAYL